MSGPTVSKRNTLKKTSALVATGTLAAALLSPSDAEASGYLTARFGADHGTPAMPNTFAVYFNPAALGGTTGTTVTGDVGVLLRFVSYQRPASALSYSDPEALNDPSYVSSNTGKAQLTNLLALPFVGVNTDFGTKNLRGGWAAYIPFGGLATWRRGAGTPGVPGSTDGVQRWHNISGQILAIYNTFAFAVRIPGPRLSFGVSVSPVIHNVATVRARNGDGSDDTFRGGNLIEGRSLLTATGFNLAASAGVFWEATPEVNLGLSYISQPGFGETRMSGTLKTQLGTQTTTSEDVDFLQTYPDILRLGGTFRLSPKWDIRSDLELVRWSALKYQCVVAPGSSCTIGDPNSNIILNVPRNWDNALGFRVGPGYYLNDQTELFGSVAVTTSAVPKETIDASTIDSTRLYGTVGARYEFSRHFALAGSYNHIYFFPVNTGGRSILGSPDLGPESRSPSADGKYRSQIGFVNLNAAYTF
jgi:long-chain fatty acid transport protein